MGASQFAQADGWPIEQLGVGVQQAADPSGLGADEVFGGGPTALHGADERPCLRHGGLSLYIFARKVVSPHGKTMFTIQFSSRLRIFFPAPSPLAPCHPSGKAAWGLRSEAMARANIAAREPETGSQA